MRKIRFLLTLLLVSVLVSCSFQELELIKMESINLTKMSAEEIELQLTARVKNPNGYKVAIVDSDLEIYVNDQHVGKARIKNKVKFPANETSSQLIVLSNKPGNMLSAGFSSLMALFSSNSMKITVKGRVKGRAGVVGKNIDIEFTERIKL
jgi:LEA14-like dessication related protein